MNKELYEKLLLAAKYINVVTEAAFRLEDKKNEPERIKEEFYRTHQFKFVGLHIFFTAVSWIAMILSGWFLIFGIVGLFLEGFIIMDVEFIIILFVIPAIVFPIALISVITLRCHTKIKEKRRDKLCIKETTPLIEQSKKEFDEMWNAFQEFVKQNIHVLDFLPEQYRDEQAVSYMLLAISDGRADTFKEVMNLYELQLHRWKMEDAARQAAEAQEYTALAMQELNRKQAEANAALKNIEFMQWCNYVNNN